jgi:tartrate dehydrogenase/decarboxylase/D-malate dehydrogenase
MKSYRIAAIPGDGIGNEVIPAGIEIVQTLAASEGFQVAFEHFDWGSERYKRTGAYIPDGGLEKLKSFDAIFFGAVGAPDVPDHISLWGLRLPICQGFDQYANVRPSRVLPGVTSPLANARDIDWVIIRENSEGEYSGSCTRGCRKKSPPRPPSSRASAWSASTASPSSWRGSARASCSRW